MDYNFLSDRQVEDMQMITEITNEMAVSDGFSNLDACLKEHPSRFDVYNRYATAALRAMRRVQGVAAQAVLNEINKLE